ncbi:MAG: ABC transporter ATP-binding protein [Bacilli bacterium]|jgi:putative ABC transport system ATP-binding protein|nr:ABC transporter ATP-binding protein [Bacilli bacterium]
MSYISINNLKKQYHIGSVEINALNGINLNINKGELVIVVGQSGAGKTTLLNLIGGMDKSNSGELIIDGNDITKYKTKMLTRYRRHDIGFVFQFYNLIPNITTLENVEMAKEVAIDPFNPKKILQLVGLEDRLDNFPSQLSGGQQQRVAIARALVKNPKLMLCDEPTGALDFETGKNILKILQAMSKQLKMTVIIITHNHAITEIGDHVVEMKDGMISKEYYNQHPKTIDEVEW